ncbi:hypothetical protein ENUP19_0298G0054 [Entamoeba nuttalli]|uniref:Protein kinase domain-containing protein n=2 Tax=Entamoeba nuttalli TaxID=412467 RepID=A0ABQ0DUS4_9EUKA
MASPRLSFRQSLVSPHSKSLSTVPLVVFLSDQNEIIQTMKTVPPASMLIWVLTPTSESTKGITITIKYYNLISHHTLFKDSVLTTLTKKKIGNSKQIEYHVSTNVKGITNNNIRAAINQFTLYQQLVQFLMRTQYFSDLPSMNKSPTIHPDPTSPRLICQSIQGIKRIDLDEENGSLLLLNEKLSIIARCETVNRAINALKQYINPTQLPNSFSTEEFNITNKLNEIHAISCAESFVIKDVIMVLPKFINDLCHHPITDLVNSLEVLISRVFSNSLIEQKTIIKMLFDHIRMHSICDGIYLLIGRLLDKYTKAFCTVLQTEKVGTILTEKMKEIYKNIFGDYTFDEKPLPSIKTVIVKDDNTTINYDDIDRGSSKQVRRKSIFFSSSLFQEDDTFLRRQSRSFQRAITPRKTGKGKGDEQLESKNEMRDEARKLAQAFFNESLPYILKVDQTGVKIFNSKSENEACLDNLTYKSGFEQLKQVIKLTRYNIVIEENHELIKQICFFLIPSVSLGYKDCFKEITHSMEDYFQHIYVCNKENIFMKILTDWELIIEESKSFNAYFFRILLKIFRVYMKIARYQTIGLGLSERVLMPISLCLQRPQTECYLDSQYDLLIEVGRCFKIFNNKCLNETHSVHAIQQIYSPKEISKLAMACAKRYLIDYDKETSNYHENVNKLLGKKREYAILYFQVLVRLLQVFDQKSLPNNQNYTSVQENLENLVVPPNGFLFRFLRDETVLFGVDAKVTALSFFTYFFSVNSPIIRRKSVVNEYIRFAFKLFIKIYYKDTWTDDDIRVLVGALKMLNGLAAHKTEFSRQTFFRLGLFSLLLHEVMLEFNISWNNSHEEETGIFDAFKQQPKKQLEQAKPQTKRMTGRKNMKVNIPRLCVNASPTKPLSPRKFETKQDEDLKKDGITQLSPRIILETSKPRPPTTNNVFDRKIQSPSDAQSQEIQKTIEAKNKRLTLTDECYKPSKKNTPISDTRSDSLSLDSQYFQVAETPKEHETIYNTPPIESPGKTPPIDIIKKGGKNPMRLSLVKVPGIITVSPPDSSRSSLRSSLEAGSFFIPCKLDDETQHKTSPITSCKDISIPLNNFEESVIREEESKKQESINPTPNNTKTVETKIEESQVTVSADKPNDTKVKEEIKKGGVPPARKKRPPPLKMVPAIRNSIDNTDAGTSSASGSTTNSSTGLLTQVEQKFKETGKLHLILDTMMFEKTNTGVVKVDEHSYENMRKTRRIYVNSDVHKEILMLLFNLIVMENGVLDPLYTDQFPDLKGMKDALFILSCHLDSSSNREIAKQLFCQESLNPGIQELLRLLSQQFFDMSKYSIIKVIGEGAYGVCSEALVKYGSDVTLNKVVIKQIKISESPKARSVLHDIFNEILILERHCRDERVSHLFEYGYNEGFYNIVMYQYYASLGSWRRNLQPSTSNTRIHLLLNIYKEVLRVCQVLNQRIIHFDIKCENFLIEPLPGVSLETVNNPQTEIPPFKLCLADFGEACVYRNDKEANTTRHRGTESIKPPEMLKMDLAGGMPVNASCDIWALGCLLYELYTSKMLFAIADVGEFYFRVLKSEELLTEENKELLGNNEYLIGFLEFVLNRDPTKRPQISTLAQRFDEVIEKFKKDNKKDLLKAKKWEKNRKMLERKQYEEIEEENIQSKKDIDIKRGIEVVDFEESKQVFKYFNNILFGGEMNDEEVYKRGIKYVMHFGEELPTSLSLTAMNYPIPKTIEEMIKLFSRIIEVLREFVVSKRAVYICGDKGYMPAALLVGFTMQKHYLSEYESYLYIQKVCPYVRLHESVLSGLKYFEKNPIPSIFSGNDKLRHFRCLCGIVDIVLTQPIDEELVRNCRCEADGKEYCPNRHNGCRIFLETMKEKSSYDAIFMKWVGVKQKNVVGMKNLLNVMNVLPSSGKSAKIYSCKSCGFIMLAIPKKGLEKKFSTNGKGYDLFIVVNNAGIELF